VSVACVSPTAAPRRDRRIRQQDARAGRNGLSQSRGPTAAMPLCSGGWSCQLAITVPRSTRAGTGRGLGRSTCAAIDGAPRLPLAISLVTSAVRVSLSSIAIGVELIKPRTGEGRARAATLPKTRPAMSRVPSAFRPRRSLAVAGPTATAPLGGEPCRTPRLQTNADPAAPVPPLFFRVCASTEQSQNPPQTVAAATA